MSSISGKFWEARAWNELSDSAMFLFYLFCILLLYHLMFVFFLSLGGTPQKSFSRGFGCLLVLRSFCVVWTF